jgi:predicted amino acid-binding ACT domain protein
VTPFAVRAKRCFAFGNSHWLNSANPFHFAPFRVSHERLQMKQFATVTVIGRDKTGVIARVTNFLFVQHANIEALEEQVTRGQFSMTLQEISATGQKVEAAMLVKAVKFYPGKQLDVFGAW